MKKIIAILGIGYVGLQSAISFAKAGAKVIAFDIDKQRVADLTKGVDNNEEESDLRSDNLLFTSDPQQLIEANFYLISVPTPINEYKVPDTKAIKKVTKLVAQVLKKDDVVILESTVFPGATRELVIPILEKESHLQSSIDFFVGYSSERIVPGDEQHTLPNMTKLISGQTQEALEKIQNLYQLIPGLKLHCTPSIEVAEASKLLENIQRNVNIALMNEFAQIMSQMGISIHDVLDAAKTKWNFLPFTPGLVGGHCIPEDPYYLIYRADKFDCLHDLISCACQINQQFYRFIAHTAINLLIKQKMTLNHAKVAILGISFKANVKDMRHSLSINLYHYLQSLGLQVIACDPLIATPDNLVWSDLDELNGCHAIILCQAHQPFIDYGFQKLSNKLIKNGVFLDIPGVFTRTHPAKQDINYWSL